MSFPTIARILYASGVAQAIKIVDQSHPNVGRYAHMFNQAGLSGGLVGGSQNRHRGVMASHDHKRREFPAYNVDRPRKHPPNIEREVFLDLSRNIKLSEIARSFPAMTRRQEKCLFGLPSSSRRIM